MLIHLSQTVQNGLTVYRASLVACAAGISVVPTRPDGSKRPACCWRVYQQRRPRLYELSRWFRGTNQGLALITGAISGGLESLDFDTRESYQVWSDRVQGAGLTALHERLTEGYLEATPHGIHLLYRCPRYIEGNQKLAKVPVEGPQRWQTLIETRGEGGLVVVAPSCGGVHPSGKPYVLLQGGIATIATITPAERQALLTVACSFDASPPPPPLPPEPTRMGGQRTDHRIPPVAVFVPAIAITSRPPGKRCCCRMAGDCCIHMMARATGSVQARMVLASALPPTTKGVAGSTSSPPRPALRQAAPTPSSRPTPSLNMAGIFPRQHGLWWRETLLHQGEVRGARMLSV